jgi:DNA-binding response OmpR family regulator
MQAKRLGSGYLPKPFEARELLAMIAALPAADDLHTGRQTPNG